MKTLIQILFPTGRKVTKRTNKNVARNLESLQFAKMARLGQTLVVMSR